MKFKLTPLEKHWILYDVGNSAFIMLVTTIMPIYFNYLAGNAGLSSVDYLAYWGYAASVATLAIVLLGPVFGTLADTKGFKKPVFSVFLIIGALGCISLGLAKQWLIFLIIFIIAKIGYSGSLIFYDSMLSDITSEERMDHVSSQGYAWGYIGSCIPFVICLIIVLKADSIGISMGIAMALAFLITALWWLGMSVPLLRNYQQKFYVKRQPHAVRESFRRIGKTFRSIRSQKRIFIFFIAFFFYIDGVYTIIDMATAYGSALGLDSTGLLLALLVTQIVAFPFCIIFGRLAQKYSASALAVLVGMFQGGIQALSRSYFTKIIPPEQSGEYFGLLDICGKGASFVGTTIVSAVSQLTGDVSKGVSMISLLFIAGLILFRYAVKLNAPYLKQH